MGTEDTALNEGIVTYDLKFRASAPLGELSLIINVEAQNDFYPGYPIIKRGMYYCGRMLSAQYGTEFASSHYEKLKKVYSIWICLNPPKNRMNTITRYSFKEENIVGDIHENEADYDLMAVTIICLGDEKAESSTGVLRMLEILFSSEIEKFEKRDVLRDEFGMTMTAEYEGEVSDMCNFSKGILEKGIEKGMETTNISNIKNLMKNLNLTIEQAMSAIGLSEKDRIYYKSIIDK